MSKKKKSNEFRLDTPTVFGVKVKILSKGNLGTKVEFLEPHGVFPKGHTMYVSAFEVKPFDWDGFTPHRNPEQSRTFPTAKIPEDKPLVVVKEMMDLKPAKDGVEVQIDGGKLWVNVDGVCRFRIQGFPYIQVEHNGKTLLEQHDPHVEKPAKKQAKAKPAKFSPNKKLAPPSLGAGDDEDQQAE